MPLLSRGAIVNFFGLADEEEYEYQDYPEAAKKTVQSTKKNTTQSQPTHPVSAVNTHEKQKMVTSCPVTYESTQPAEKRRAVELHQSPTKTVAKERTASRMSIQPKANLAGKITVMEPEAYSETMAIAKRIIAGEAVLANFHSAEERQAGRIVDFLTGTVYTSDGDIERVGNKAFLCTPIGMEINSSTTQSFADTNLLSLQEEEP